MACFAVALGAPLPTEARITRLEILRVESPTFEGTSFGTVGPYEKIVGRAFGEVDPHYRLNTEIQDIHLAPQNTHGAVEYQTDFYILKPIDLARSNGLMLYEAPNRGNKLMLGGAFLGGSSGGNDPTTAADAGDGFLQRRGYTLVWSGWQGDVLSGANRLTLQVPVATDGGVSLTGRVRAEFIVAAAVSTQNLSSGFFTGLTHTSYETVSLDTSTATLTMRVRESDPRIPIPPHQWAFADCRSVPFPGVPSPTRICLQSGFNPNVIYELLYTAQHPTVLGLGFAATRDLVAFLRHARQDDIGTPNPLAGGIQHAMSHGISQSGRYLRAFLPLGFNEDEEGRMVFEGMYPHIAAGQIPLNVRFGQPGRGYGQHEDHLYPSYESPFTWQPIRDPIAGRTAWLLERCRTTHTCPRIVQTVSSTEYWQGRMSLDTTDALGRHDVGVPGDVRIYLFASTQHVPVAVPVLGLCQQVGNPNPYREGMRALLVALERWMTEGEKPPPSQLPLIREQTLVHADQASLGWPSLPGVTYTGLLNELTLLDFGPDFDHRAESGIVAEPPPVVTGHDYVVLVPKVDADGNEIAGIRSATLRAPLGTYTGWNLRRAGFAEDELCGLQGTFMPFKRTQSERLAADDPRLSLEERYGDHTGYVAAVTMAANELVEDGYLLPEDAARLIAAAEASNVLK